MRYLFFIELERIRLKLKLLFPNVISRRKVHVSEHFLIYKPVTLMIGYDLGTRANANIFAMNEQCIDKRYLYVHLEFIQNRDSVTFKLIYLFPQTIRIFDKL